MAVEIPVEGSDLRLRVWLLPKAAAKETVVERLVEVSPDESDGVMPRHQLLEGTEYGFAWLGDGAFTTSHPDLFHPDDVEGRTGRLRTGLQTGTVVVDVCRDGEKAGRLELEIRSKKLDYLSDYRWMLRDITDDFAEAILLRFASAQHRFEPDPNDEAGSLYPRFAFLQSVLDGGELEAALRHIVSQPHLNWTPQTELRSPARGLPATSAVARQLTRPGPRMAVQTRVAGGLTSLPMTVAVARPNASFDTYPNRFVRYALESWRSMVALLAEGLAGYESESSVIQRGQREAAALLAKLDGFLAEPIFRSIGRLRQVSPSNQVLQKRSGYRTVYKAFLQSQLAATLTWKGGDDVYGAGKRDVATLYEYWVYLQVAGVLSDLCNDMGFSVADLLRPTKNGLSITIDRKQGARLKGRIDRHGVKIRARVYFNRKFDLRSGDSWSRTMKPDVSVRFRVQRGYGKPLSDVWLHFDAKYRVSDLTSLFGQEDVEQTGKAVRADLLKMHAYRDAIRRTAGAYVLFPGDRDDTFHEYTELLPGLGAFVMRPGQTETHGAAGLRTFLHDVLDHLVDRATDHERVRYWRAEVYPQQEGASWKGAGIQHVLPRPPRDTWVTLGFVKSSEHFAWIEEHQAYNVRGPGSTSGAVSLSSRVLAADVLVLYCVAEEEVRVFHASGDVEAVDRAWLVERGYPDPGQDRYFVIGLGEPVEPLPDWLTYERVADHVRVRRDERLWAAPMALTWFDYRRQLRARG